MCTKKLITALVSAAISFWLSEGVLAGHGGGTSSQSGGSLFGSELIWNGLPDEVELIYDFDLSAIMARDIVDIEQRTKPGKTVACTLTKDIDGDSMEETVSGRCTLDISSSGYEVGSCTKETGGVNASFFPLLQICGTGADTTGTVTLVSGFGFLDGNQVGLGSAAELVTTGPDRTCQAVFPRTEGFNTNVMGQTALFFAGDRNCGAVPPVDQPIQQRVCADVDELSLFGSQTNCTDPDSGSLVVARGRTTDVPFTAFLADANPKSVNTDCGDNKDQGAIWTFAAGSEDLVAREIDFETWRAEGIAGDLENPGVAPLRVGTPPDDVPQCEFGFFLAGPEEDARCRIPTCSANPEVLGELLRQKDFDGDNFVDMLITLRTKGVNLKSGKGGVGNFAGVVEDVQLTPTQ